MTQKVANNPLGSYLVSTTDDIDGSKIQKVSTVPAAGSLGQQTMANSSPVVIASDQTKLKVGEYSAINGLPNFYSEFFGLVGIPTCQVADPATLAFWDLTGGAGAVRVVSSTLPTGAAIESKQDTMITSLQLIDDLPHTFNEAFKSSCSIGGQLDDSGTVAATENNVAPVRITAQRSLHTTTRSTLGVEVFPEPKALANGVVNPTLSAIEAYPTMWDSSTSRWNRVPGTTANGIDVDVTRVTGTVTISGTVTASNTAGNVAHDGADSGNPVKVGMKSRTAHVTAVANNDRSDWTGDVLGQAKVSLAHNTRTDTFTTAAPTSGTAMGDGFQFFRFFSLTVQPTGAVTSWTVVLQYSLDNVTWTTFLTHTNVTGAGVPVFSADAIPRPVFYLRSQATALVLGAGTNVIARILGVQ